MKKAIGRKNLRKVWDFMKSKNLDLIIFKSPDANVAYFSNFFGSCLLAISKEKRVLIVDPLEAERAKIQADVEEILNIKKFEFSYSKSLKKNFTFKRIGIVKSSFSLKLFEELSKTKVKFFDIEDFVAKLRAVKFKEEIKLLKKSAKIANSGIKVVKEELERSKIKEDELARNLENFLRKRADSLAFEVLVASGKRSSFPHPYPSSSKNLIKGFGYVDFGTVVKGYCSDVTVPFFKGRASEKERKIVKILEEAYEIAISSIKPKVPTWKPYEVVEKFLKIKGLELKHGLGHGLGLTVHDFPSISIKKKCMPMNFEKNMVFTIEPGIYLNSFGIRLENDFLLKKRLIKLTNSNFIWC